MSRTANGPAALLLAVIGATVLVAGGLQWLVDRGSGPKRTDACAGCHLQVDGIEAAHQGVSCAGCHLGDVRGSDEASAHAGMVRLPGQLADVEASCGSPLCHASLPARLRTNVMTTMNGVVSVDRWAFGEQPTKSAHSPVAALGHSPADSHLRNLCASCHLGAVKAEAGPMTERSRGGGCLSCHLDYDDGALRDLERRAERRDAGTHRAERFTHPRLTSQVPDGACFGCHSRSGRVSLNFQGWHEGEPSPPPDGGEASAPSRTLEDGRRVWRAAADVHAEAGLGCTDCHGSWEVMGDGRYALHREDQAAVGCSDCHLPGSPPSVSLEDLDAESLRLARREGLAVPGQRFVLTRRGRFPLVGASPSEDGGVRVTGRFTRRAVMARSPSTTCARDGAHGRLACPACHEAWVPRCISCHARFDASGVMFDLLDRREAPGEWEETPGPTSIGQAALGARVVDGGVEQFETFAPGMILSLFVDGGAPRFRRLFAPIFAHTIRREARLCESCHREPLALGYGEGHLSFGRRGTRLTVSFKPVSSARLEDGLPLDAWIGFLQARGSESTTRDDTRPLSREEQQRVLAVGGCFECHPRADPMWARALLGPGLPVRSPRCASVHW